MLKKVSRDPIHSEVFLYPLEIITVDTPPVQRLRFLSQLAGATIVYPGATHTRFAHSLGTMHIAGQMFSNIVKNTDNQIIEKLYSDFEKVISHILSKEYVEEIRNNGPLKSNLLSRISKSDNSGLFENEIVDAINSNNSTIYSQKLNIYQGFFLHRKMFHDNL